MILLINDTEIEVTTTEEMEEIETASQSDATQTDAVHHFDITEQEIQTVTEFLPKIYDLFTFWFLCWVALQMLSRIKNAFFKSTKGIDE